MPSLVRVFRANAEAMAFDFGICFRNYSVKVFTRSALDFVLCQHPARGQALSFHRQSGRAHPPRPDFHGAAADRIVILSGMRYFIQFHRLVALFLLTKGRFSDKISCLNMG